MKFVILIMLPFLNHSLQQTISFGKCPDNLPVVKNFDMNQHLGTWYEQYRYFIATDIGFTCSRINYTHSDEGPLLYSAVSFNQWKDRYTAKSGIVKIEGQDGEAKFLIEFPKYNNESIMHWVLDTDYKSYSVIWSCNNEGGFRNQNIWVYTRDQHPSKDILQKTLDVLKKYDISAKYLAKTDQQKCCNCNVEEEAVNNDERSREVVYDDDDVEIIYDLDNIRNE